MQINNVEEMVREVEQSLNYGLRMSQIKMSENLGIHVIVTDIDTGESRIAYLGFPENKTFHQNAAWKTIKPDILL